MKEPLSKSEQKQLDEMSPMLDGRLIISRQNSTDNNLREYLQGIYLTFHQACTNACDFCRNYALEYFENKTDFDAKVKSLKIWLPYLHSVSYGGGEPLLFIDAIRRFREQVKPDNKEIIITSGIADKFNKHKTFISDFSRKGSIYLSRHHVEDHINNQIFGNKNELLSWMDLVKITKYLLQSPLLIKCTCSKSNGIDDVDKILDYVERTQKDLGANICFNDLDPHLTKPEKYNQNQIDDSVFMDSMQKLLKSGKYEIDFYTSRGFEVTTLIGENGNVGFRRYHKTPEETKRIWDNSQKRSFDFSMMPNGNIFGDEQNIRPITLPL